MIRNNFLTNFELKTMDLLIIKRNFIYFQLKIIYLCNLLPLLYLFNAL